MTLTDTMLLLLLLLLMMMIRAVLPRDGSF